MVEIGPKNDVFTHFESFLFMPSYTLLYTPEDFAKLNTL